MRRRPIKPVNSLAVEMIPIRLLISIVVIAAIAVLLGVGLGVLRTSLAQGQVEQQCHELVAALDTMVQSGAARDVGNQFAPSGTVRVLTLSLPDSLVYLSFGGDPDVENTGVLHSRVTGDGSVIYYRVHDGSKQVMWLSLGRYRFREGLCSNSTWILKKDAGNFIIDHGGTITLVFELVEQDHVMYVLIHGNDGIE
jgi:hypothetical protein